MLFIGKWNRKPVSCTSRKCKYFVASPQYRVFALRAFGKDVERWRWLRYEVRTWVAQDIALNSYFIRVSDVTEIIVWNLTSRRVLLNSFHSWIKKKNRTAFFLSTLPKDELFYEELFVMKLETFLSMLCFQ